MEGQRCKEVLSGRTPVLYAKETRFNLQLYSSVKRILGSKAERHPAPVILARGTQLYKGNS